MTKLYILYATPRSDLKDFVMAAPLRIIEEYLGRQVPRTFVEGESAFSIPHSTFVTPGRVGNWTVAEMPEVKDSPYLERFPVFARAYANAAYEHGFMDRASEEDPS